MWRIPEMGNDRPTFRNVYVCTSSPGVTSADSDGSNARRMRLRRPFRFSSSAPSNVTPILVPPDTRMAISIEWRRSSSSSDPWRVACRSASSPVVPVNRSSRTVRSVTSAYASQPNVSGRESSPTPLKSSTVPSPSNRHSVDSTGSTGAVPSTVAVSNRSMRGTAAGSCGAPTRATRENGS